MKIRFVSALILVVISTIMYYIPSMVIDLSSLNMKAVPKNVYSFYSLFLACNFLLIAVYSGYLFAFTNPAYLKTKIVFLWMAIAETSTFLDHFLRIFIFHKSYSTIQMVLTLLVFIICAAWLIKRSYFKRKSDTFNPEKTYTISYKPRNIIGILNHIKNLKGHSGIYQDGKIYKFSKKTGKVESRKASQESVKKTIDTKLATIEEIERLSNVSNLIGKKFNLLKYNCNHLVKNAK